MPLDPAGLAICDRPGGCLLTVKVVPGASRTRAAGTWGAALKLAVAAAPEAGRANAAVRRLLAELLAVRPADVEIISGHGRPLKRVRVTGLSAAEARRRLARS